ncbi:MarR family winged helix-turn-helix transcriptional regulator [Stappia stellulata]|uniref:MarR family winged helix-turn-helix transcriptional regulator n=1 Tax=Stappia stellulata TaxID=71235 RepID=UPI000425BF6A|nr:helix-turn-helix domain-containing protein [Stappia stellulata]
MKSTSDKGRADDSAKARDATPAHSPESGLVTQVILETFRLNGALLSAGDALVGDLGLTSARWQVLGAVALEGRPLSVAQIARRMGLSRQAVQRVVNDLTAAGLVALEDNPDHKRARLVVMTGAGEAAYAEADRRQIAWAKELSEDLGAEALAACLAVLRRISVRCEGDR